MGANRNRTHGMNAVERARPADGIEVVRLDRPEVRNALGTASIADLRAALAELAADESLRVLVLSTTSTRAFCAGADVGEELDHAGGVARMQAFAALYADLDAFPVPVICVCVGNVVGAGAELAAGSDLRVGGDNLKLAWAGARLGVPVGPARLAPLVGLAVAKDLVFTGRVIGMDEAQRLGLLTRTAPAEEAEATAIALAGEIAQHPPDGLRRLKAMFRADSGSAERIARENGLLVDFQREGAGLPQGAGRE
jgi:enoyl-CoA hydratase/carnithine racemase